MFGSSVDFPGGWRSKLSKSSNRLNIWRLAGSKLDKSVVDCMHCAPVFKQKEHDGLRLSHFVRRALQTWQAVTARFLGYAAVPRGAGRLEPDCSIRGSMGLSSLLTVESMVPAMAGQDRDRYARKWQD